MRFLLLSCALLTACGGGGGGPSTQPPNTTQPPPDLTQEVYARWADAYDEELAAHAVTERDRDRSTAFHGQFGSPAHYEYFVQDALAHVSFFTDDCRAILADVETRGTVSRDTASGWIDDFRASFRDYLLERYEYLNERGQAGEPFYTDYKNQLINGINAEFDQLQADV